MTTRFDDNDSRLVTPDLEAEFEDEDPYDPRDVHTMYWPAIDHGLWFLGTLVRDIRKMIRLFIGRDAPIEILQLNEDNRYFIDTRIASWRRMVDERDQEICNVSCDATDFEYRR